MADDTHARGRTGTPAQPSFRAEDLLASLLGSSSDAIVAKTLEGTITRWNRGAEELYGYSAHEAIGHSITMLIPEERREQESGILDSIRRGERVDLYETERVHRDGHRIDVEVTVSPVYNPFREVVAACSLARGVGRQASASKRLERLVGVLGVVDDAMFTVDAGGQITTWNAAAERAYGYTEREIFGSSVLVLVPAADREDELQIQSGTLAGGDMLRRRVVHVTKDGSLLDVMVVTAPILLNDALAEVLYVTRRPDQSPG